MGRAVIHVPLNRIRGIGWSSDQLHRSGLSRLPLVLYRGRAVALRWVPIQELPGNVFDLLESPNGEYWVAGLHGVYHFNPAAFRQPSAFTQYRANTDYALAMDGANGVWCGSGAGLYHVGLGENVGNLSNANPRSQRLVDIGRSPGTGDPRINTLLRDRAGVLWIGSVSGLYR